MPPTSVLQAPGQEAVVEPLLVYSRYSKVVMKQALRSDKTEFHQINLQQTLEPTLTQTRSMAITTTHPNGEPSGGEVTQ